MNDRAIHWIRHNQQERMPARMIAFDTEARWYDANDIQTQEWRIGTAIRWRTDLKTGDHAESANFKEPDALWSWISEYSKRGTRTVVWAHNLGYDARISRVFTLLPQYGYQLDWCNLDRNVSSMTWRSDRGTLVFADLWTWLPMTLAEIGGNIGVGKAKMPHSYDTDEAWFAYCMNDTRILYLAVKELMSLVSNEHMGNWQPTGAGMAYATWRHKYLTDKILVHTDMDAIAAEREAMYTGRAEAWRHGRHFDGPFTEMDMRSAYLTIASESNLPRKLHMHTGTINLKQYANLSETFAMLCRCEVTTEQPTLPYRHNGTLIWPVGTFTGWYWDTEINTALKYGAKIRIRESYAYVRSPILGEWARFVLDSIYNGEDRYTANQRNYLKHTGRSLIGRIAIRTPTWEVYGENPEDFTGISYVTFPEENATRRMMHIGNRTLLETDRREGKDSLPQVTGWIMARCRSLIWEAMYSAGLDNVVHVDTDGILVSKTGLANLIASIPQDQRYKWAVKGSYPRVDVYGPRQYFRADKRVASGIPYKAEKVAEDSYQGEQWSSVASDLESGQGTVVRIRKHIWHMKRTDPRRKDDPARAGYTIAIAIGDQENKSSGTVSTS